MVSQSSHRGSETQRFIFLRASVPPWLRSRFFLWLFPLTFIGLFFFYPLGRILVQSFDISVLTPENLSLTSHVLLFTLYQAFLSTLLTLILGLPAAYLFARFDFPGKALLRALTAVPFMLPTVVVAALRTIDQNSPITSLPFRVERALKVARSML